LVLKTPCLECVEVHITGNASRYLLSSGWTSTRRDFFVYRADVLTEIVQVAPVRARTGDLIAHAGKHICHRLLEINKPFLKLEVDHLPRLSRR